MYICRPAFDRSCPHPHFELVNMDTQSTFLHHLSWSSVACVDAESCFDYYTWELQGQKWCLRPDHNVSLRARCWLGLSTICLCGLHVVATGCSQRQLCLQGLGMPKLPQGSACCTVEEFLQQISTHSQSVWVPVLWRAALCQKLQVMSQNPPRIRLCARFRLSYQKRFCLRSRLLQSLHHNVRGQPILQILQMPLLVHDQYNVATQELMCSTTKHMSPWLVGANAEVRQHTMTRAVHVTTPEPGRQSHPVKW